MPRSQHRRVSRWDIFGKSVPLRFERDRAPAAGRYGVCLVLPGRGGAHPYRTHRDWGKEYDPINQVWASASEVSGGDAAPRMRDQRNGFYFMEVHNEPDRELDLLAGFLRPA